MAKLYPEYPEAVSNTAKIAELCNVDFTFGVHHLPEFKHPQGLGGYSYFEELCRNGFRQRYPDGDEDYRERLRFEMDMIHRMGFVDYFLIVSDFILYAKNNGFPSVPAAAPPPEAW